MQPELEIITKEIPAKGKAYIIVRRCPPEGLDAALRRGAAQALSQGASLLYAASTDPEAPLEAGEKRGYQLIYEHDMLRMSRTLTEEPPRPGRLRLEPLVREKGGTWLALYNEGFFNVPNSATYDGNDLERVLGEACSAGFVLLDEVPVGVYELGFAEEQPEIEGVALRRDFQGRGLGRELLLELMGMLARQGHTECWLRVATSNRNACALYRSLGFGRESVLSRWFQVVSESDLRIEYACTDNAARPLGRAAVRLSPTPSAGAPGRVYPQGQKRGPWGGAPERPLLRTGRAPFSQEIEPGPSRIRLSPKAPEPFATASSGAAEAAPLVSGTGRRLFPAALRPCAARAPPPPWNFGKRMAIDHSCRAAYVRKKFRQER